MGSRAGAAAACAAAGLMSQTHTGTRAALCYHLGGAKQWCGCLARAFLQPCPHFITGRNTLGGFWLSRRVPHLADIKARKDLLRMIGYKR